MALDYQQQQSLLERLDQMLQLQQQSTQHFEDLRKTHEEFQKRSAATIDALERRIKFLEDHQHHPHSTSIRNAPSTLEMLGNNAQSNVPTGTPLESASSKEKPRNKVLTAEQTVTLRTTGSSDLLQTLFFFLFL
jgi:hypothetical protein